MLLLHKDETAPPPTGQTINVYGGIERHEKGKA